MSARKKPESKTGRRKFSVAIPITGVIYTEVDANSEAEAIEKALQKPFDTKDIETWQQHRHVCQGNVFYGEQCDAEAEDVGEADDVLDASAESDRGTSDDSLEDDQ